MHVTSTLFLFMQKIILVVVLAVPLYIDVFSSFYLVICGYSVISERCIHIMKVLLLLLFVTLASSAETVHDGEIFDKFNIIEILDNDTERKAVLDCVMGRSPCGQYQLIKDKGSNILKTRCADCTIEQKEKFEASIKKFEIEHYDEYEKLMAKFVVAPAN